MQPKLLCWDGCMRCAAQPSGRQQFIDMKYYGLVAIIGPCRPIVIGSIREFKIFAQLFIH